MFFPLNIPPNLVGLGGLPDVPHSVFVGGGGGAHHDL